MSTLVLPLEDVIPDASAYPAPSNPNLLIMIACICSKVTDIGRTGNGRWKVTFVELLKEG